MGNRPPPKTDDRRQRRNKPRSFALQKVGDAPAPPVGLLKSIQARWFVYWESDLASATRAAHLPTVERLFQRYDERERAYRLVRKKGRLTKGSQGQFVANPLLKYIDQCDAEIRQLEDRLGLNPRAMAALGGSFAKAQKSLDDVNSTLEEDDEDDIDSDPRTAVVAKIVPA